MASNTKLRQRAGLSPGLTLIVIAGANGSGKTTFSTRSLNEHISVVDPDAIARENGLTAIGAGRKAIAVVHGHLAAGRSFGVETTLSGHSHNAMISGARARGYRIEVVYLGTSDISINLERIRNRVALGGHDVPEIDVRRRAQRSLKHAPTVVAMADYVMVLDNSGPQMLPIIEREDGAIRIYTDTPPWAAKIVEGKRALSI